MLRRTVAATALAGSLALIATGCSSSGTSSTSGASAGGSSASSSVAAPASGAGSSTDTSAASTDTSSASATGAQPFGAACADVPKTGAGSFNGMTTAPVATAASNNPVLSTLVTAVKAAGLVSTLNSAPALTVFAPYNGAFAKIPAATLKSVLADKATLTKILTYHVLAGKIAPSQLAGTHKTLEGADVKVTGSGTSFKVGPNGSEASVICGDVQTANATVYIIDSVMMPPAK